MISTGKFNPITGQEILKAEEHDIDFWDKDWEVLSLNEKAIYLNYRGINFLSDDNSATVEALYYSDSHKNRL